MPSSMVINMKIGQLKYGIAGLEKKELWSAIKQALKPQGFILRTHNTLIKDFPETVVMLQLQTSCYDSVDYYLNIACTIKELKKDTLPLFDRDRMNFLKIEDKGSLNECLRDIDFYTDGFSSVEKLKHITLSDICLYNASTPQLLSYLQIGLAFVITNYLKGFFSALFPDFSIDVR